MKLGQNVCYDDLILMKLGQSVCYDDFLDKIEKWVILDKKLGQLVQL